MSKLRSGYIFYFEVIIILPIFVSAKKKDMPTIFILL